jgi:hypothetical protein
VNRGGRGAFILEFMPVWIFPGKNVFFCETFGNLGLRLEKCNLAGPMPLLVVKSVQKHKIYLSNIAFYIILTTNA